MGQIQKLTALYTVAPADINLTNVLKAVRADLPELNKLSRRSAFEFFSGVEKLNLGVSIEGNIPVNFDHTYARMIDPNSYVSARVGDFSRMIYVDLRQPTSLETLQAVENQITENHVDYLALHVNDLPPNSRLPADVPHGFRITFTPGKTPALGYKRTAPDKLYEFLGGKNTTNCGYTTHRAPDTP